MLELRHLAVLDINPRQTFSENEIQVFKNLRQEITEIMNERAHALRTVMAEYDIARSQYYSRLLRKDKIDEVERVIIELFARYNVLIDARNVVAATKLWTKNFIIIDEYITTSLACPMYQMHYDELDKLLKGVLQSTHEITLDDPSPMDMELHSIVIEYETLCKSTYEHLHINDTEYNLIEFSAKMQGMVQKEDTVRDEYLEARGVYERLNTILEYNEPMEDDIADIFNLLGEILL
jgi:hypothetical protein